MKTPNRPHLIHAGGQLPVDLEGQVRAVARQAFARHTERLGTCLQQRQPRRDFPASCTPAPRRLPARPIDRW
jgi:hypothetical protein